LATFSTANAIIDVVEQPAHFAGREERIDRQPSALRQPRRESARAQLGAKVGCPAALPDNHWPKWSPAGALPYSNRFALIRDRDCRQLGVSDGRETRIDRLAHALP